MRRSILLFICLLGVSWGFTFSNVHALTYTVGVGDTWIWKYYNPQTPDNFYYLRVSVTHKTSTAITVTGTTYDPVSNTESPFDEIAPNFVYSTEQLTSFNTPPNPSPTLNA